MARLVRHVRGTAMTHQSQNLGPIISSQLAASHLNKGMEKKDYSKNLAFLHGFT
jgi:hypothetical protein